MLDLRKLAKDRWLRQNDLADILGVAQSKISDMMNHPERIRPDIIEKLKAHFGAEVVDSYNTPVIPTLGVPQPAEVTFYPTEPIEDIKEEVREEVRAEEIKQTIVLTPDIIRDPEIDIKAEYKKGNLQEYAKPTQDTLPFHTAKVYTYCDDMEPEIRAGEPVLVQLLPAGIAITPGLMYFIDLPSGGIIRYIEKELDGYLYLKARNSNYGDIVVNRDDVQSLSSVRLIMRTPRAMSMKESTATELLVNKDRHLDRLLEEMAKGGEREKMLIEHIVNSTKR